MRLGIWLLIGLSIGFGLLIAAVDLWADGGDVSPIVPLFLLVGAGFVLGILQPVKPWRWAILAGIWLPLVHIVGHPLGLKDNVSPNTETARLMMLPVTVAAALIGAYTGAFLRNLPRRQQRPSL